MSTTAQPDPPPDTDSDLVVEHEIVDHGPLIRPFAAFLQDQRYGASHDELSEGLHKVIEAVRATGKAGSVTYTVNVRPLTKSAGENQLVVADKVAVKVPEGGRDESVFFVDDDGNLSRRNPNQPELPGLRDVTRTDPRSAKEITR